MGPQEESRRAVGAETAASRSASQLQQAQESVADLTEKVRSLHFKVTNPSFHVKAHWTKSLTSALHVSPASDVHAAAAFRPPNYTPFGKTMACESRPVERIDACPVNPVPRDYAP